MPERARRWYVKRIENFIKAFPDTRLQAISAQDLAGYLEGIGRKLDCHELQGQVLLFSFKNCSCQFCTPGCPCPHPSGHQHKTLMFKIAPGDFVEQRLKPNLPDSPYKKSPCSGL